MKRGLVKFLFNYGERYIVEIAVPDQQIIQTHAQWSQIKNWWQFGGSSTCHVLWDDGSELLLARDKILSISMTPKDILEIV